MNGQSRVDTAALVKRAWNMMTADPPMPPYAALDWLRQELGTDDVNEVMTLLTRGCADRWERWYDVQLLGVRDLWYYSFPSLVQRLRDGLVDGASVLFTRMEKQTCLVGDYGRYREPYYEWFPTARRDLELLTELRRLAGVTG